MTEIEALLARLKELDQETWERLQRFAEYQRSATPWNHLLESQQVGWTIQGVIQEAIAARGWEWECHQYSPCGMSEAAIIMNEDRSIEECGGDSPAEALLRAYIAALEACR